MLLADLLQPLALLATVALLTPPLGVYIARVMSGERTSLSPLLGPVERAVYAGLGTAPDREQTAKAYARSLLVFSAASIVLLFALQRAQGLLPLNPDGRGAVAPAQVMVETAHELAVSQVVLGESHRPRWKELAGRSIIARILRETDGVDVHIIADRRGRSDGPQR
jgi:K+-transporting ATPase ATPase A chain